METLYKIIIDYSDDNPFTGSSFYFDKSELLEHIDFFLQHRNSIVIEKVEEENEQV